MKQSGDIGPDGRIYPAGNPLQQKKLTGFTRIFIFALKL
jgi:hypothetical protein